MQERDQHSSTLMASVRRLIETILTTLRNRLELLAIELQEEKYWIISALIWATAVIFFSFLSAVVVTITVVAFVPPPGRPFALLGFSIFYLLLTAIALLVLRKKLKGRAPPFSDSVAELKKDITWLRSRE